MNSYWSITCLIYIFPRIQFFYEKENGHQPRTIHSRAIVVLLRMFTYPLVHFHYYQKTCFFATFQLQKKHAFSLLTLWMANKIMSVCRHSLICENIIHHFSHNFGIHLSFSISSFFSLEDIKTNIPMKNKRRINSIIFIWLYRFLTNPFTL